MNDIKLTDEATIDSLKEMAIKFSKDTYVNRVLVNAINLIHRLQSENKELRTESDRMVAEHLAFVELAKKANEQQKSEIAELKAQCSKSSYRDSWKNKFFKAQEEIERLTKELEKVYEIERANIRAEIADAGTSCHWCERQTAKGTAKEILDEVSKHYGGAWLVELYNRYGVEV